MGTGDFDIVAVRSPDELAGLVALFREYAGYIERTFGVSLEFQGFEAEVSGLPGKYAPPKGEMLLARDPSGPLGCVALRPLGAEGRCEMKRLYVSPAGRGRRVGRALVDAVIVAARQAGYYEMCLDTHAKMDVALPLYRRAGFADIAPYYDTPIADTVFLGLPLSA